ncbi:DUF2690 domain-containing protein [Micromonospora narathiwatensis]|uniref:DUF2690 domain-containing protein n=1 Tax=Micromonospora narathiwatensis TaxID=299146 RepID=A0A1A8ZIU9_9ACTN|nr:DUF2690 domain-containing protein [Micromonospora narathiwatensis]SBT43976.1 Protein of unknown function (DUF2690) [Micromonospora narathiwatensis]
MFKNKIASALALFAVTVLAAVIVQPGAAQAASCWSTECEYKDPSSTGCDASGVQTLEEITGTLSRMKVELRYSATCHTVWARGTFSGTYQRNLKLWLLDSNGNGISRQWDAYIAYNKSVKWTTMFSYNRLTKACTSDPLFGMGTLECTRLR